MRVARGLGGTRIGGRRLIIPGVHERGVPLQTTGPRISNPARSMLMLSVLT
jgi:hypothetical protein